MSAPLVVFDLDFTLWDGGGVWCDCTSPPYCRRGDHVLDSAGREIRLYPEVVKVLQHCKEQGIPMALASRTSEPSWARELIKLFDIGHYFSHEEIYPGSKVSHFQSIQSVFQLAFEQMIFFDDEMRNIDEVGALGVKAVFVEKGVDWRLFSSALA